MITNKFELKIANAQMGYAFGLLTFEEGLAITKEARVEMEKEEQYAAIDKVVFAALESQKKEREICAEMEQLLIEAA